MPRGGYHPHAERWGRKSGWLNASVTKTIRIPEALAEQVLDIAHRLDEGEIIGSDTKSNEQINKLQAELEQLRFERDQMDQEIDRLHAKVGDLDLQLTTLREQQANMHNSQQLLSELEATRDRALSKTKLGKQASDYKRYKKGMDLLIVELRQLDKP